MLRGNLREHFFPDLLVQLYRTGRTGVLSVTRERVKKEIFIREGVPVLARSNVKGETLNELLVARGIITRVQEETGRALQRKAGVSFGEALLKQGSISKDMLFAMKRRQFLHMIYSLFGLHEGEYRFDERELAQELTCYEVSMPSLLTFGIRRILDARGLCEMMGGLTQIPVPTDRFPEHQQIKFTVPELTAIHQVDGTKSIQQIIEAARVQPSDVIKTMLILSCLEYVKFQVDFNDEVAAEIVDIDENMETSLGFQKHPDDDLDEEKAVVGDDYPGSVAAAPRRGTASVDDDFIAGTAESFGLDPHESLRSDAVQAAILDSLDDELVAETVQSFGADKEKSALLDPGFSERAKSLDEGIVAEAERTFGLNKEGRFPTLKQELSGDPPDSSGESHGWMDSILFNENSDFVDSDGKKVADKSWEEEVLGTEAVWPGEEVVSEDSEEVFEGTEEVFEGTEEVFEGTEEVSPFMADRDKVESRKPESATESEAETTSPGFRELAKIEEEALHGKKKKKYVLEGTIFLLLGFAVGLFLLFRDGNLLSSPPDSPPIKVAQSTAQTGGIGGAEEVAEMAKGEDSSAPPLPEWVLEHDADPLLVKDEQTPSQGDNQEGSVEDTTDDVAQEKGDVVGKTDHARILGLGFSVESDHQRVVINLDRAVEFKKYALPEQEMVFVSLQNARFSRNMSTEPIEVSSGHFKKIRMGQYKPHIARVVLDDVESKQVSVAAERNPDRIVIIVNGDN